MVQESTKAILNNFEYSWSSNEQNIIQALKDEQDFVFLEEDLDSIKQDSDSDGIIDAVDSDVDGDGVCDILEEGICK